MNNQFLSIEYMQEKLAKNGHKEVWNMIEKIANPLERLAYRHLFFLAGGVLE